MIIISTQSLVFFLFCSLTQIISLVQHEENGKAIKTGYFSPFFFSMHLETINNGNEPRERHITLRSQPDLTALKKQSPENTIIYLYIKVF